MLVMGTSQNTHTHHQYSDRILGRAQLQLALSSFQANPNQLSCSKAATVQSVVKGTNISLLDSTLSQNAQCAPLAWLGSDVGE